MQESQKLSQQQRLTTRLSPMQVRFVKMLEMTSPEMDEAVIRELDDNPALEKSENESTSPTELTDSGENFNESSEDLLRADYKDDDDIPYYRLEARNTSRDDKTYNFIPPDDSESLYDNLNRQIKERKLSVEVRAIAEYIIGNLDSNGYLLRKLSSIIDDLAFQQGIDVDYDDARQALDEVRSLDPAGVGASDLRDCLLLQLRRNNDDLHKLAQDVISNYFEPFSMKHYHKIISGMKISENRFREVLNLILSLNPKPGASFGSANVQGGAAQPIVPDFMIDIDGENIVISLNNNIPELQVEESFENAVKRMERNARQRASKENEFVMSRYNDAREFINLLRQRQETLFAVMSAIVKFQKKYFLTEDEHNLLPMGLKDIATITGYDLSVISRATNNKYLSTPWGILPLKFFFSESLGEGNEEASAREIQAALKRIVDNEDKRHPLSDDSICQMLNERGYDVSRRTIAKYRDRLGIPVARLRKDL